MFSPFSYSFKCFVVLLKEILVALVGPTIRGRGRREKYHQNRRLDSSTHWHLVLAAIYLDASVHSVSMNVIRNIKQRRGLKLTPPFWKPHLLISFCMSAFTMYMCMTKGRRGGWVGMISKKESANFTPTHKNIYVVVQVRIMLLFSFVYMATFFFFDLFLIFASGPCK